MIRVSLLLVMLLTVSTTVLYGQGEVEERVQWRHSNLSLVLFDKNPDGSSTDRLINIYASDNSGTDFYPTITSDPVQYDFVISPWTRELYGYDLLLLEQEGGLAIANKEGKIIRKTSYNEVRRIQETEWLVGKLADGSGSEVFQIEAKQPILSVDLQSGEMFTYEAGYFLRTSYGHPTRVYNQQGDLVIEEAELSVTPLATNEPRFFYQDHRLFKSWLTDLGGNVIADLPKSTLFVKGQGDQIKVQTGATKMYWVDLAGNRIEDAFSEVLIEGEFDVLHNCGEGAKVGAYFYETDTRLPCEYDRFAVGWDSTLIIAKKYTTSIYFHRNGETFYDPGGHAVSRYLGSGYFVKGGREGCQFVKANGEIIAQTEISVSDPTAVAQAVFLPDSKGGKFLISPKYGGKFEAYDTSGVKLFTYEGKRFASFNWGPVGDDIQVTMGREVFFLDRNGQELRRQCYRNPRYIHRDGELKYIITNQIYPERVDGEKGAAGLLDGVSTHLIDAKTDEVIVSSNTGMQWIDDDHLLLYFGFTYGIVKVD